MICLICGEGTLTTTTSDVEYMGGHDIWVSDVPVHRCDSCGEDLTELASLTELNARVAQEVARRPGRLMPQDIKLLRQHLDWSAKDFAQHFSVDPATVSRWETGSQSMAVQVEKLLRLSVVARGRLGAIRGLETLLDRPGAEPATSRLVVPAVHGCPGDQPPWNKGLSWAGTNAHLELAA